jgi:hypothetical protein
MTNVVKFPDPPEWASKVDAKLLDGLIAKGYLRRDQRHNWCAVEAAINKAFYAAVYDARPELSLQEVIVRMLQDAARR